MTFAENNRISHRQLYRQMVLSLTAPFLLCLFGGGKLLGAEKIVGTVLAIILLLFYVIFLIRVSPDFANPLKPMGRFFGKAAGVFFVLYVILTASFLLDILEEIVPKSLVSGVSGELISFFAIVCASIGTHRGMQRRGRAAEVTGGIFLVGIGAMLVLSAFQGKMSYLSEMPFSFETKGVFAGGYGVLCAFSGLGLLPFALEDVEKQGSAGKTVMLGVLTLGGLILAVQMILPAVFGWNRVTTEKYPVLPLLAGADMPGNVLSRFDVLWLGFVIYGLLFSIGSLLHYGHQIIRKTELGTGRFWIALVVYLLSRWKPGGFGIQEYYGFYLAYIFLPVLLIIQVCFISGGRGRRIKKVAGSVTALLICLFLGGCAGVEPEERMYALALGVDAAPEGFAVTYGTPDMSEATGQEKPGENGREVLTIKGETFEEIQEIYGRSQEKFMDMGHLEAIIIGRDLIADGRWEAVLLYLKKQPFVGEDIYVFQAEKAEEILKWNGGQGSSVGEYLRGLLENDFSGKRKKKGVTLRTLYHEKYENGTLPKIPGLVVEGDELQAVPDA